MPLPYVHLVQLLVDSLLVYAPIALYPQLGVLSVPVSGILTLFFHGLLALSKAFLDPFGNAEVGDAGDAAKHDLDAPSRAQTIRTDALISEVNSASTRWWRGAERLPFDTVYTQPERVRFA